MRIPAQVGARSGALSHLSAYFHGGGDCPFRRLNTDRQNASDDLSIMAAAAIDTSAKVLVETFAHFCLRKIRRLPTFMWETAMRYDLELYCSCGSLFWGVWIATFLPISSSVAIPSARGLIYCHEVFAWSGIPSDYVWFSLTAVPAFIQLLLINKQQWIWLRSITMVIGAFAFSLFTILLMFAYPKTTGVPMYLHLALAHLICIAQISRKKYHGGRLA